MLQSLCSLSQAIAKQAEVCAGLAVEYAEVVKVLESARNNDWDE